MGKALRDGYREKAFLMTKFDGRTKDSAAQQIDESLKRLQTDHLDLLQFHETIRFDDPDRFFAAGGAAEALVAARKSGKHVLSGSPGTRIRTFISICWNWRAKTISNSTPCKCR